MTNPRQQRRPLEQRSSEADPAEKNVRAVASLEHSERSGRTRLECFIDRFAEWAGHPWFPMLHVAWFGSWVTFNVLSPHRFDPYPFTFLMLIVSLEAILLTSFVLAAQDRTTREADRRGKLDLQINMLAEQELTAILRSINALAKHSGLDVTSAVPQLPELTSDTRIDRLAKHLADAEQSAATKT
jgi:uncharacterized membrane protein